MKKTFALIISAILISGTSYAATNKSVDEYRKDLKSDNDTLVIEAARGLGAKKSKDAIDDLIAVIKSHKNPKVRIALANSLGMMGTKKQPTTALNEVVQSDGDNSVVYASLLAILNLADFKNASATEALDYCEKNKTDDPFITDVVKRIRKVMKK